MLMDMVTNLEAVKLHQKPLPRLIVGRTENPSRSREPPGQHIPLELAQEK